MENVMAKIYFGVLDVNINCLEEKYPEESSSFSAMRNAVEELKKILNF